MQIKRMSLLLILVILTFQLANAIPERDIDNLCRETTDAAFCLQHIDEDPRIVAAHDLGDVLTIALSQSEILVDDAMTHLNSVTGQFDGTNGEKRIGRMRLEVCKKNYGIASAKFHTAWERSLKKLFREASDLARVGNNAVMDCENTWKTGGPVQESPLTSQNTDISKMNGIVQLLVRKLAP